MPVKNAQTRRLRGFFQRVLGYEQDSVPLKSQREFSSAIKPTDRQSVKSTPISDRPAAMIVSAAVAQGVILAPGAEIERSFQFEDIATVLENGCCRDTLERGAWVVTRGSAKTEVFRLTEAGYARVLEIFTENRLRKLGVL